MGTLLTAVTILGAIIGAIWVFFVADEKLDASTGAGIFQWFIAIMGGIFFGSIGIGGLNIIGSAMSSSDVGLAIVGIIVAVAGFGMAFASIASKGE